MIIYLATMAPGLTWANDGADGGDLIAAAAAGGVAHPTGYPVYLLLARVFQWVPIGSLAYRTNLMSALATVLAAIMVYEVVTRFLSFSNPAGYWLAGMLAGYAFSFSPIVWSQAVITEVYALQALFIVLILYLALYPLPFLSRSQKWLDRMRGLILGLAMGNHVTTFFLVPAVMLASNINRKSPTDSLSKSRWLLFRCLHFEWTSLLRQLFWFGIGLLIYLILPLRALNHPAVNWGNPVTLKRFWWLVSGQLYQSSYLQMTLLDFWDRIQAWASILLQQFGLPGLILGLLGLVVFFSSSKLHFLTFWLMFTFSGFAILYGSLDSYVYLIPAFISFAIWIGLGLAGLMKAFSGRAKNFLLVLNAIFFIYFFSLAASHWSQVDASRDMRAEDFGKEVAATIPGDAIVFLKGDQAVFTMWYYNFAQKERPDIILIASDLLHFDWYQEVLQSQYPALVIPEPYLQLQTIALANPLRPLCSVQYSHVAEIKCEGLRDNP